MCQYHCMCIVYTPFHFNYSTGRTALVVFTTFFTSQHSAILNQTAFFQHKKSEKSTLFQVITKLKYPDISTFNNVSNTKATFSVTNTCVESFLSSVMNTILHSWPSCSGNIELNVLNNLELGKKTRCASFCFNQLRRVIFSVIGDLLFSTSLFDRIQGTANIVFHNYSCAFLYDSHSSIKQRRKQNLIMFKVENRSTINLRRFIMKTSVTK